MASEPAQPAAPGGDPAWVAELEALMPRLHVWSHLRLRGQRLDPDDLVQEILCRVVERIGSFRGGTFAAWVFTVGKHVLLESLRKARRAGRVRTSDGHSSRELAMEQVPASITTLTRKIARRDDVRLLLEHVATLDETDRRLVELCGLEELPPREVAPQLALSEDAVAKRWYRLRQRLQHWPPAASR